MAKKTIKLRDLSQVTSLIDISDTEQFEVRPLNLREMVLIFLDSQEVFLPLFVAGLKENVEVNDLAPFLLNSPELVARIIALASDEPDMVDEEFQKGLKKAKSLAATVQLIALYDIWKMSVPDSKKAGELLSEVTVLLKRLSERDEAKNLKTPSPIALPAA